MVFLACRTDNTLGRDTTLKVICKAALPPNYFANYVNIILPTTPNGLNKLDTNNVFKPTSDVSVNGEPSEVIAMSSVCPTLSSSPAQNTAVMVGFLNRFY
jgi:hypothetical protein